MIYIDPKKLPRKIIVGVVAILCGIFFLIRAQMIAAQSVQHITCALFDTQDEAQQKYNSDPQRFKRLDGYDRDGVVCESLPRN